MRVLIACEFSGVVREAFRKRGHDAWSCDILPSLKDSPYHYQGYVEDVLVAYPYSERLGYYWDLIIAHPPCTYLAVSGNAHYSKRPDLFIPACDFAKSFMDYAPRVCVENPVGRLSKLWRKPDQYIQPYEFGHDASKKTGLWLKNLPLLVGTKFVPPTHGKYYENQTPSGQNKLGPSKDRGLLRSKTYQGIAEQMAEQWGNLD